MFATLPDGTRLFYDVYGSALSFQDGKVVEKPQLVFLHGGPGLADHTLYVPFWSQLSDVAQVIFIDMRGHGRSDRSDPSKWTLAQWGHDVADFCDAIGVHKPIVAGFSFGGWVALSYAIQFPAHASKLILCNTEAQVDFEARIEAYRHKGGNAVAQIVADLANAPNTESAQQYVDHCIPLFCKHPYSAEELGRCIKRTEVWDHFDREEYRTFNFLPDLHQIECPTLVLAGEEDPEHPPVSAERMVKGLTGCPTEHALLEDAGDPVYRDQPKKVLNVLQKFITK